MWKIGIILMYLLILSIFDCREKKVPAVLLAGGTLAILLSALIDIAGWPLPEEGFGQILVQIPWREWVLGMLPGLFLVLIAVITQKAGLADGMVLMGIGICMGYRVTLLLLCISLLLISFLCVPLLLFHKVQKRTELPYLPFLALSLLLWHGLV